MSRHVGAKCHYPHVRPIENPTKCLATIASLPTESSCLIGLTHRTARFSLFSNFFPSKFHRKLCFVFCVKMAKMKTVMMMMSPTTITSNAMILPKIPPGQNRMKKRRKTTISSLIFPDLTKITLWPSDAAKALQRSRGRKIKGGRAALPGAAQR